MTATIPTAEAIRRCIVLLRGPIDTIRRMSADEAERAGIVRGEPRHTLPIPER